MTTISDIVKCGLCTGCGVCTSESSGDYKMQWNEDGFIVPKTLKEDCTEAIRVCPFNPSPEAEVQDEDVLAKSFLLSADKFDVHIGRFKGTYIGYSDEFRTSSSSGGLATYVFQYLLQNKIVDHIYTVKEVNGSYEYQLLSDIGDITQISKTRYIPVTLDQLFENIDSIRGTIAVSGVACFLKAIRLKQHYHPELKTKIPFLVGIICGGWKSRFFSDFLAQSAGVEGEYFRQEYRMKDATSLSSDYSFGAFDIENRFHQMKMRTVGDMWGTGLFKSKACEFCTDVLSELADISLGDAWLDKYRKDGLGNSIVITRTSLADNIIQEGMENGKLSIAHVGEEDIIRSQSSSFSHRQDAMKFRINALHRHSLKPHIRQRVLKNISLAYKVVQIQREHTRRKSILIWKSYKSVIVFNQKMKPVINKLRFFTRIYHKLR